MFLRAKKTVRPAIHARLGVEQLEGREVPAGGIVTITVVNNNITLQGDGNASGNDVRLLEQGLHTYDISGQNGTKVRLGTAGAVVTTLSGISFTGNLVANFGSGNDRFDYTGLFGATLGDFTLNMGAGNDNANVTFVSVRNMVVNQAAAGAGTDNDNIFLSFGGPAAAGGIRGNLTLNNFDGNDTANLTVGVAGNLTIANRGGGENIALNNSQIGKVLAITNTTALNPNVVSLNNVGVGLGANITNPGPFQSTTTLGLTRIGGALTVVNGAHASNTSAVTANGLSVGGAATFTGGAGPDNFNLATARFGKNVTLTGGEGINSFTLGDVRVGTNLLVNSGKSGDTFSAGTFDSYIGGNVTFNMGDGSNNINLNAGAGKTIETGGNLIVTALAGIDIATASNLNVRGTTSFNLGAAADSLTLNNSNSFHGNVGFNMGAGNDTVTCNPVAGQETDFYGNLNIVMGLGADTLIAGNGAGSVFAFGSVVTDIVVGDTLTLGFNFRQVGMS